jgi:hypothetical protein
MYVNLNLPEALVIMYIVSNKVHTYMYCTHTDNLPIHYHIFNPHSGEPTKRLSEE